MVRVGSIAIKGHWRYRIHGHEHDSAVDREGRRKFGCLKGEVEIRPFRVLVGKKTLPKLREPSSTLYGNVRKDDTFGGRDITLIISLYHLGIVSY